MENRSIHTAASRPDLLSTEAKPLSRIKGLFEPPNLCDIVVH